MTAPDCTDHGSLILEYVRGNLSEAEGLRAEAVLGDCRECQAWMDREFSGAAFGTVDDAIGQGLDTITLPDRRRHFGWLAAAAAILMVAGGMTMLQIPDQSIPMVVDQQDQNRSTQIVTFDFEGGPGSSTAVNIGETSAAAEAVEADPLFADDLEDGGAGSWTIHT
ncbi:MAG: hypothetical protein ABFS37_02985 [Acidobacteriota bacterium]